MISYSKYEVWSKVFFASNSRLFTTSRMQLSKELLMFAMSFIPCCSRSRWILSYEHCINWTQEDIWQKNTLCKKGHCFSHISGQVCPVVMGQVCPVVLSQYELSLNVVNFCRPLELKYREHSMFLGIILTHPFAMSRKSSFAAFSNSVFSAFPNPGRSMVNVVSKPVP